ncbi:hypothetical protein [Stakelama tenebrarum]|nr:hypothetical protein [Sphingosinithalassobacter tenebrarum]
MTPIEYASLSDMEAWAARQMLRVPDFVIGSPAYLRRWWIVPRNAHANVYLHQGLRDDDDRALHDHPWDNQSFLISGRYREITTEGAFVREAGSLVSRKASDAHRLELIDGAPFVSLFFTGPKVREWGFHCPNGWVDWRDFTAGAHGELVGRGCGE